MSRAITNVDVKCTQDILHVLSTTSKLTSESRKAMLSKLQETLIGFLLSVAKEVTTTLKQIQVERGSLEL